MAETAGLSCPDFPLNTNITRTSVPAQDAAPRKLEAGMKLGATTQQVWNSVNATAQNDSAMQTALTT